MIIHPPLLYLGFVSFVIPYAFAIAALVTGRTDDRWIRITRRWTLVAWLFLSLGLLLGGRWAYDVLGWGGYWGWDPVEIAAFMPWLTGTAFLHSVMIQEKRRMLKHWNMLLIILTYDLVIFGTLPDPLRRALLGPCIRPERHRTAVFCVHRADIYQSHGPPAAPLGEPEIRNSTELLALSRGPVSVKQFVVHGYPGRLLLGRHFPFDLRVIHRPKGYRRPAVL